MIKSMTAYGRGESHYGENILLVEIRTLNHRFRDIQCRLPRGIQVLEDEMRSQVTARIGRGRVEISVQLEHGEAEASPSRFRVEWPQMDAYMKILREVADRYGIEPRISAETLFHLKDVITLEPEEPDLAPLREALSGALSEALDSLEAMRLREGEALDRDFRIRLEAFEKGVDAIRSRAPLLVEAFRERLRQRIQSLLDGDAPVDDARLAQEVALYADRSDISEELTRLGSHLEQFRHYLTLEEPLGRRLEFLIQEMHREVNTLSSKSQDAEVSRLTVELKGELEKMREQAQNVE